MSHTIYGMRSTQVMAPLSIIPPSIDPSTFYTYTGGNPAQPPAPAPNTFETINHCATTFALKSETEDLRTTITKQQEIIEHLEQSITVLVDQMNALFTFLSTFNNNN